MIRANNEKELMNILRIISQESVGLSRRSLRENKDPYLKNYYEQFNNDEELYGDLHEQDEDFQEFEEEPVEDEGEFDEVPVEDEGEFEEEGEEAETEGEAFGVSFDSVITAINTLRAGRSLKNSAIKDQTSAYYDRLDDNERKVLLVFLNELGKILSGALQGSEAQDPSDPPVNLDIMPHEEEPEEEEEGEFEEEGEEFEEEEDEFEEEEDEFEEEEEEGEDTSPPIRVDEAQDYSSLRRKIRRIMLRG